MEVHQNPKLYAIRHSLSHVLAQAVQQEFSHVKLGFGPPTDTGFYYDFDFGAHKFTDTDLSRIEKRMRKIIAEKQVFQREDLGFEAALEKVDADKEPYKNQNIRTLKERGVETFSFYSNGPFVDLCEGPHVANTQELAQAGFKLDRLAGAYWLGDEKNKMLTRIYALAFVSKEELDQFIKRRENALKFDHKKLGTELELFLIDDIIGKGLPLWLPNGTIIRDEIENYAKEMEAKNGYKRVATPILAKKELYLRSQHLPAYQESMFPPMVCKNEETGFEEHYYLRPMNCPHHHIVYGHRTRSYRELPLRLAEYGTTFRYEQSGELSGLLRVRGMTLNDAHIYCRLDQVGSEVEALLKLYKEFYETFKLKDYVFRLSIRDASKKDKYKGSDAMWDQAETLLTSLMNASGIPYVVGAGEAAFYGPKIDIQFRNLMGREETVSTIQIDFLAAVNFDLKYVDEQGQEQRPVVIHRAPLSTLERFVSYLIEYYGGAFPTWMAPVQTVLIPVNEECYAYCQDLRQELESHRVRVEVDMSANSFGKKIRTHTVQKVPLILIIGKDEVASDAVTVRRYGMEAQEKCSRVDFVEKLCTEIRTRANFRETMGSIIS